MSRAVPRFRRTNNPLPVPANNVYEVVIIGLIDQQETLTTLYYMDNQAVGIGVNPGALQTAAAVKYVTWTLVTPTTWALQGSTVKCLNNPTVPSITTFLGASQPGVVVGDAEGTIMAATIRRQTAVRGQAGRGHVNMPAVPQSFVAANGYSLTPAAQTAYGVWATANLNTVIVGGGINFTPALVSRGLRTQTPKLLGAAPITLTQVAPVMGTARRRKIGRGV